MYIAPTFCGVIHTDVHAPKGAFLSLLARRKPLTTLKREDGRITEHFINHAVSLLFEKSESSKFTNPVPSI